MHWQDAIYAEHEQGDGDMGLRDLGLHVETKNRLNSLKDSDPR